MIQIETVSNERRLLVMKSVAFCAVAIALTSAPLHAEGTSRVAFDVEAARDGLDRFVMLNTHVPPANRVPGCSLISDSDLAPALSASGIADPFLGVLIEFEDALYAGLGGEIRGVDCVALAGEENELVPAYEVTLSAVDLQRADAVSEFINSQIPDGESVAVPGVGGDAVAGCSPVTATCSHWWSVDSLVLGVTVRSADGNGTSLTGALADVLLPEVLDTLSEWAAEVVPETELRSEQLEAARRSVAGGADPTDTACPAIDRGAITAALENAGASIDLADWGLIDRNTGIPAVESSVEDRAEVVCGGDGDETTVGAVAFDQGVLLTVEAFSTAEAARSHIETSGIIVDASPLENVSGRLLLGSCFDVGERLRTCDSRWWQESLIVNLTVTGHPSDVDHGRTNAALTALSPSIVGNLAE